MVTPYVLGFENIDKTKLALVGGKGANLGELARIEGIRVPDGFCVTTQAYEDAIARNEEIGSLVGELSRLGAGDKGDLGEISARIRKAIEAVAVPRDAVEQITQHLARLGDEASYAVRSSATAEDLPTASFAGQQDTYLNVCGIEAVLRSVSKCWASLFNDRAVAYRIQHGIDHRKVQLSVVIQRMVFPVAAGILFTADPVTSNRSVTSIDASFGLGEALVSGLVNPDNYKVRDGEIVDRQIGVKTVAIFASRQGGTEQKEVETVLRNAQTLEDDQILQLERMGRTIEAHFGQPQDIEWCLAHDGAFIVQSRPITTLFPVPEAQDGKNHVYMSFGHQQMMTDAMKPLGLSYFLLGIHDFPLVEAGGRLFIDLAHDLASPVGRSLAMAAVSRIDPLIDSAIKKLMKRKDFMEGLSRGKRAFAVGSGYFTWQLPIQFFKIYRSNDASLVDDLISRDEAFIRETRASIENLSGEELFEFIAEGQPRLEAATVEGIPAIWVGAYAGSWINKHMEKWLGEKGAADVLSHSVPYDVTSEMGLALLDVADVVRQHPALMERLPELADETFFDDLAGLEGGAEVGRAIHAFLEKYGARCPGEIDITRPRWSEQPSQLVSMILSDIKHVGPNAHQTLFQQGLREAEDEQQSLLSRLERTRGGRGKVKKTTAMIERLRNFAGYREYPKYLMMQYYWNVKQALLREAGKLAEDGVIREKEDVYYLSFEEFRDAVRTRSVDRGVIEKRRAEFEVYEKLSVPRVMTSEGEVLSGQYDTGHIPNGALAGIPASAGIIEGRARVISSIEDADVEEGDILVTMYTDPSWTPVFVSVKAVVTEVGGMATHGAVVAREYGLPAVVGVENATRLIKDGQQIRVNGTQGYVEVL
jgi:rifampicin phosphotransferase